MIKAVLVYVYCATSYTYNREALKNNQCVAHVAGSYKTMKECNDKRFSQSEYVDFKNKTVSLITTKDSSACVATEKEVVKKKTYKIVEVK